MKLEPGTYNQAALDDVNNPYGPLTLYFWSSEDCRERGHIVGDRNKVLEREYHQSGSRYYNLCQMELRLVLVSMQNRPFCRKSTKSHSDARFCYN